MCSMCIYKHVCVYAYTLIFQSWTLETHFFHYWKHDKGHLCPRFPVFING